MTKKKIDSIKNDYARSEIEFLAMMKTDEPVIAIISEDDNRRNEAASWLSEKLQHNGVVAEVSLNSHSAEYFQKLDPDILIGDSIQSLRAFMGQKPTALIRNRGYIYFVKSDKQSRIKAWLGIDNRGQTIVDVWLKLNAN